MENMLLAWEYIDFFIRKKDYDLIFVRGGPDTLEVNHLVHYGQNDRLRQENHKAIEATTETFSQQIDLIRDYYRKNKSSGASAYRVAAKT